MPTNGIITYGKGQNATMYYNPDALETPSGEIRNPRIALAHETGHLEDFMYGRVLPIKRNKKKEPSNDIEHRKVELNERTSLELENIIRKVLGYEKREKYYREKIGK